jgi:6-phosphogluconate dehydrogenase (decarboxylating)
MESVVEFTDLVTQRFEWGFYIGAAEYAMIVYDVAVGANWVLQLDDTTGVETIDSTIPATVDPTKIEIVVDAAGNVTWALDDVAMPLPSGATLMTANPHYIWWRSTDTAAAAHTTAVDYVIVEQLRQQ